MNKDKKKKNLIYTGLGFPIRLINAPMRKVYGQWVFDFSMGVFQETVLHMLAIKPSPLMGPELRFIIDYFELSYRDFAKLLGVSHAAVVKWEKEKSKMNPNTEVSLRLYILNYLKVTDQEFRKRYLELSQQHLSNVERGKAPLDIDLDKIAS
jgi:DNA-binding transcriptional regulator YiaG